MTSSVVQTPLFAAIYDPSSLSKFSSKPQHSIFNFLVPILLSFHHRFMASSSNPKPANAESTEAEEVEVLKGELKSILEKNFSTCQELKEAILELCSPDRPRKRPKTAPSNPTPVLNSYPSSFPVRDPIGPFKTTIRLPLFPLEDYRDESDDNEDHEYWNPDWDLSD